MQSKFLAIVVLAVTGGWAVPASAYFGPGRRVPETRADRKSSSLTTRSVEALLHGQTQRAIDLSTEAIAREPKNPWAHYARANALAEIGRTEAAVEDYDSAIELSGADVWGRSVAIYGRARALDAANRCAEAAASYQEYAKLVAHREPDLAADAREYAGYCVSATSPTKPHKKVAVVPAPTTQTDPRATR